MKTRTIFLAHSLTREAVSCIVKSLDFEVQRIWISTHTYGMALDIQITFYSHVKHISFPVPNCGVLLGEIRYSMQSSQGIVGPQKC